MPRCHQPTAPSRRGRIPPARLLCREASREQAAKPGRGGAHSGVGDTQGARLSPATPRQHGGSPGRMSVRLQPEGHRPLALLHNQPTSQMSQQRSKTNKQQLQLSGFLVLTHYSLILETWLSVAASLLLGENPLPAQPDRQPPALRAEVLFPFLKNVGNSVLLKTINLTAKVTAKRSSLQRALGARGTGGRWGTGVLGGPLPCTAGLRTWDGVSWISRVHSPAARSPQQWTVMNSQPLNPSFEWSNTLQR